ncbi:MAG: hypothetical protein Q9183_001663 [Haloplaca sp. 2 TL-2023]
MAGERGNASSDASRKRPLTDEGASSKQNTKKKRSSKASGLKSGATTDVPESDTFNLKSYNDAFKPQKERTAVSRRVKKEQNEGAFDSRPGPRGRPLVWADFRTDFTETLDYFRSRQGGNQTNDGHMKGSLLSADDCPRQFVGDEIILTRA